MQQIFADRLRSGTCRNLRVLARPNFLSRFSTFHASCSRSKRSGITTDKRSFSSEPQPYARVIEITMKSKGGWPRSRNATARDEEGCCGPQRERVKKPTIQQTDCTGNKLFAKQFRLELRHVDFAFLIQIM